MLSRHSIYFKYLMILVACTGMALLLVYLFTANLFSTVLNLADKNELDRSLAAGEKLLEEWSQGSLTQEELREAVNPVFSTGRDFLLLTDTEGNVLAYTDEALPYLTRLDLKKVLKGLDKNGTGNAMRLYTERGTASLIAVCAYDNGCVLAGQNRAGFDRSLSAYQFRMIFFLATLLTILVLMSFFSTRQIAKPAINLSLAAEKLCRGEEVHIPEEFHGEINGIAHSFNVMSDKVSAAIQDLRREKEAVTLIFEGLEEGIIAMDENGDLITQNSSAAEILRGAGSDVRQEIKEKIVAQCAGGSVDPEPYTGTFVSEGRVIQYTVTALPRRPDRAAGAVALLRDITEQERLENTRREYVANISHELRTPLTSIRGISEGLQDGLVTDPEELHRYYTMITEESTRLSRLVNDLLELSGLQTSSEAFELETISPGELVMDLHDRNRRLFSEAGIGLKHTVPKEELPDILSNEDRLSQVLNIFLDNARKYTPPGGMVEIGCRREEGGVLFYVTDNGIGMNEETQRMAFDRFHQAEKSHSSKGSGLGLAIAKAIMDKMDIAIALRSSPGEGSTFSFVVPEA